MLGADVVVVAAFLNLIAADGASVEASAAVTEVTSGVATAVASVEATAATSVGATVAASGAASVEMANVEVCPATCCR